MSDREFLDTPRSYLDWCKDVEFYEKFCNHGDLLKSLDWDDEVRLYFALEMGRSTDMPVANELLTPREGIRLLSGGIVEYESLLELAVEQHGDIYGEPSPFCTFNDRQWVEDQYDPPQYVWFRGSPKVALYRPSARPADWVVELDSTSQVVYVNAPK